MGPKRLDIHEYSREYKFLLESLEKHCGVKSNFVLIKKFDEVLTYENLGVPRRIKVIRTLAFFSKNYLKKDFKSANIEDLKSAFRIIENKDTYSVWTKQSYKVIIKKFYNWLENGDNYLNVGVYPEKVRWLNTNIKLKDKPRVKASDLLTEEEIKKLIDAADKLRDKAFISLLYELGARIGEIGNLKIGDISQDKYGFIIDLSGKTGHRTPRVIISSSYLMQYLNDHPGRDNNDSPLWIVKERNGSYKPLKYPSLRCILLRTASRAGIIKVDMEKLAKYKIMDIKSGKRIYPHLFRHTRCTHVLLNGELTETEAKLYFGWVPDTDMIANYSHLRMADVNNKILKNNGLLEVVKEDKQRVKKCPRCGFANSIDFKFCGKCSGILDLKTAAEIENSFNEDILSNETVLDSAAKSYIEKKAPEIIERLIAERPELLMQILKKKK